MRLSKHPGSTKLMMNITPLIDIVFLLIIFFVTVSQITKVNEAELEMSRQKGGGDRDQWSMIINVDATGKILISGKERSMPETIAIAGMELSKVDNNPNKVRVLIRHDRRGTSGVYNELLRQFKQLGIKSIHIGIEVKQ